jgi:hypothetical protein
MSSEISKKEVLKQVLTRSYLNKDFQAFRNEMEKHIRSYYGDKIKDVSIGSFMGMFLDTVSMIGDTQSFYLDHQFHELSPETAVEPRNIERHLRDNRVPMTGATPAVVAVTFELEVPAIITSTGFTVDPTALPIIDEGTILNSKQGILFNLTERLDFGKKDRNNQLIASMEVSKRDLNNNPTHFFVKLKGTCISGQTATDSFTFNGFEPFKEFVLSFENVTDIISVIDNFGNSYYELENLANDIVYLKQENLGVDSEETESVMFLKAAPYRYVKKSSISTGLTVLRFGGGNAESTDDDLIPDPSKFALPLYGKTSINRITINPNNLLGTNTLGTIVPDSTVTITYRYGGGLRHNISAESVTNNINTLYIRFPNNPSVENANYVKNSLKVTNESDASGGLDALSVDELKALIPSFAAAQSRVVETRDALARIYTMPSTFGRVFRAALKPNPWNNNSSLIYVLSKGLDGTLTISNDTLKGNLAKYLNTFRIIPDSFDILDAQVINFKIEYQISITKNQNKQIIIQNINKKLEKYFSINNFQIEQPLNLSEINNIIFNNPGVLSVEYVRMTNLAGTVGERTYSSNSYDLTANTRKNIILAPNGGIFELKYPSENILGSII